MKKILLWLLCSLGVCGWVPAYAEATPGAVNWHEFVAESFTLAQQDTRFILLDLEAVWCHWCHVMDATTYQDPGVAAILAKHYVATKADHDARPDLAERYRDYGWPATVILTANGVEVVKRAGYIPPENMRRLLQAVIDDPTPEAATTPLPTHFAASPQITATLRTTLMQRHLDSYDPELGGLKTGQKYIERDSVAWDLALAAQGDTQAEQRVRQTLDAAQALLDPAFGGIYQYSTHGDWAHPHYEKIMLSQAGALRLYALAARQLKEPRYLVAAQQISGYLEEFLSAPDGSFYVSQDADLKPGEKSHDYFALDRTARLKRGLPRVDKHRYAQSAGLAAVALVALHQASGEARYLERALAAVRWAVQERRLWGGGFRHDKLDASGPYLSDTLALGWAFLALHQATGAKEWLARAEAAGGFIAQNFAQGKAGIVTAVETGLPITPTPQLDENIAATRFAIALYQASASPAARTLAEHGLRYLVTPVIALSRLTDAGILLAAQEYTQALAAHSATSAEAKP
jgi:uncharacterized protein YyaL (SSP411 family)